MANTENKKIKYCVVSSCKYFRGATDVKMFKYADWIYILTKFFIFKFIFIF